MVLALEWGSGIKKNVLKALRNAVGVKVGSESGCGCACVGTAAIDG